MSDVRPFRLTSGEAVELQGVACDLIMVKRTAKRGANADREFWGCTGYPACRGTCPIG